MINIPYDRGCSMFFRVGGAQCEGARVCDSVMRRGERDGEGRRGGMDDMTAVGETVVDRIRGGRRGCVDRARGGGWCVDGWRTGGRTRGWREVLCEQYGAGEGTAWGSGKSGVDKGDDGEDEGGHASHAVSKK